MELCKIKRPFGENVVYFLKWTLISFLLGGVCGTVGGFFSNCVAWVTAFRQGHDWTLYLMPAAGVLIVWLYHVCREDKNKGTDTVLEAIAGQGSVTAATGPLIFIATVLTHFVGGSSGREGAALQLGGSMGRVAGRLLRLDEKDKRIAVMCGMSAVFAALFGTPAAAAIFPLEVASVGLLYHGALIPCMFSAYLGAGIARLMGAEGEHFTVMDMPGYSLAGAARVVILAILCALVSIGFCELLHGSHKLYGRYLKNPYIRILAASAVFIGLTLVSGTRDYNGGSMQLIERAMEGQVRGQDFLLKALFTAVALGAGFKGGEIVPTLCVGATFGCAAGHVLGLSPSLCAACGMAALFAGVTNCPVSTLLIAIEMFGGEGLPFYALAVAVAFAMSGRYSLYGSQRTVVERLKIGQSMLYIKNEK